jgi:MoaD family protein
MKVTFKYYAQVRQAAGTESETVDLEKDADIAGAVAGLSKKHGDAFRAVVQDDTGNIRTVNIVLVNGTPADPGAGKKLSDGDVVSLFSPVAGG